MSDENREETEAVEPPQETVTFAFDRLTVARFREIIPGMLAGRKPFKPGRPPVRLLEDVSTDSFGNDMWVLPRLRKRGKSSQVPLTHHPFDTSALGYPRPIMFRAPPRVPNAVTAP